MTVLQKDVHFAAVGLFWRISEPLRATGLAVAAIVLATSLSACECVRIGNARIRPQAEMTVDLATAPAIFVGTVVSVVEVSDPPGFPEQRTITIQRRVTFIVDEAWKGVNRHEFSLITGTGAGDCGYPFKVGLKYLVITTDARLYPEKEPQVGICSNSMAAGHAHDYVAALRRLKRSRQFPSK